MKEFIGKLTFDNVFTICITLGLIVALYLFRSNESICRDIIIAFIALLKAPTLTRTVVQATTNTNT